MPELFDPRLPLRTAGRVGVRTIGAEPDRLVMFHPKLDTGTAAQAAFLAAQMARLDAPKLTGASSGHFTPIWGDGWFGIVWFDRYVWFQERGIKPFTMWNLAGKTIPMWVDDTDGKERAKNPRAKTRVRMDGKVQVLIFRRAAQKGQRKIIRRRAGGRVVPVSVPMSYPGAPGRINRRAPTGGQMTAMGVARGGTIMPSNVGVRWRHPGLIQKGFLQHGIEEAARLLKLPPVPVEALRSR